MSFAVSSFVFFSFDPSSDDHLRHHRDFNLRRSRVWILQIFLTQLKTFLHSPFQLFQDSFKYIVDKLEFQQNLLIITVKIKSHMQMWSRHSK